MIELDPYLTIVNKNHHFHPSMIESFKMVDVLDEDGKTYMEAETYKAFCALTEFLEDNYNITLTLTSAGRTIEHQQKVLKEQIAEYGEEKALQITALPGQTEHHLGTAIDAKPFHKKHLKAQGLINNALPSRISNLVLNKDKLYGTMHKHLEDFGFILRYTPDKEEITGYPAERWHIRYVGKEHAKIMNEGNMCLEEYVKFLANHSSRGE